MTVRLAQAADIPACADLLHILFSQDLEFEPQRDLQVKGLALILGDPGQGTLWVAEAEGHVVGMVSLLTTVSTALGGAVGVLEDLVVAEAFRGLGLGKALLDAALSHARVTGLLRVTLLTDHDNARALGFYAKYGFRRSPMVPLRLPLVGLSPASALP